MANLNLYLLGRFRVRRDGEPLPIGRKMPRRPLQLLQAIAVLGPREASRSRLVAALWPDAEGDAAIDAFEIALHRLRRLLGDPRAVTSGNGHVGLDPHCVWVDVEAFDRVADAAEYTGSFHALEEAFALYDGPLLEHEDEAAWLLPARERLRSRFLRLASFGARAMAEAGREDDAVDLLHRAIEHEPLAEDLYRRLIRFHAAAGRTAEAAQAYRDCARMLRGLLGIAPSPETRRAAEAAGLHP